MRVIMVNDERFFVAHDERELWTISLRLLNERRLLEPEGSKLRLLLDGVTDDQDGETAIQIARSIMKFNIYPAETI